MPIQPNTERVYAAIGTGSIPGLIRDGIAAGQPQIAAAKQHIAYCIKGSPSDIGNKLASASEQYLDRSREGKIPQLVLITAGNDLVEIDTVLNQVSEQLSQYFGDIVQLVVSGKGQSEHFLAEEKYKRVDVSRPGLSFNDSWRYLIGGISGLDKVVAAAIPRITAPRAHEEDEGDLVMSPTEIAAADAALEKVLRRAGRRRP
ncbi:MAG: hypothetical protein OXU45_01695 [Candidatus Melainabacteria bacterium]|nr:hypothetical protein [Candidatus Melainabacteria bacterium]